MQACQAFGDLSLLPISMSVNAKLLHRHLRGYKDDSHTSVKNRMSFRLAALLLTFMNNHARCLGPYDTIALVPSSKRVAMEGIIEYVAPLRAQYVPTFIASGTGTKRDLDADRFSVARNVTGERILLLDDTFTSGASLFSAMAALRSVGADVVGPVVLGRHVQPAWEPSQDMLSWLDDRKWDEHRCARCDGEERNPGQLV